MSTAVAEKTFRMIPTKDIVAIPGTNPRGEIDLGSDDFAKLKASIEARGIETPIKVAAADATGIHPVIFGFTRFAAAEAIGLEAVPALVDEDLDEKGRFLAAITENRARADMTPMAEARALQTLREDFGMKQAEAAEAMSMSERSARNRQKLLDVPDPIVPMIESGEIPLEAIPHLAAIATVRPEAVVALVGLVRDGKALHGIRLDMFGDMASVADALGQVAAKHGLQIVDNHYGSSAAGSLPVATAEQLKEIKQLHRDLPSPPHMQKPGFRFTTADGKAAKAGGALLELSYTTSWGAKTKDAYITDGDLVFELAKAKVPAMQKAIEQERAKYAERRGVATEVVGQPDADRQKQVEKEERKRKREQEMAAKANGDLLQALDAMPNPKATDVDVVRLVCAMALGDEDLAIEFVKGGLGALDPKRYGDVEEAEEDAPLDAPEERWADDALRQELREAKNAPECLRVVLRAAIARRHALETAGGQRWMAIPGPQLGPQVIGPEVRPDLNVLDMLDDIADRFGILPDAMAKATVERRREREKQAAELGEQAAEHARLIDAAGAAETDAEKVLAVVLANAGTEAHKLAKALGVRPNRLYRILGDLEKEGKVSKNGHAYTAVAEPAAA